MADFKFEENTASCTHIIGNKLHTMYNLIQNTPNSVCFFNIYFLILFNNVEKCLCTWFDCLSVNALTLRNILQMS